MIIVATHFVVGRTRYFGTFEAKSRIPNGSKATRTFVDESVVGSGARSVQRGISGERSFRRAQELIVSFPSVLRTRGPSLLRCQGLVGTWHIVGSGSGNVLCRRKIEVSSPWITRDRLLRPPLLGSSRR